jgi:hypothetical protein
VGEAIIGRMEGEARVGIVKGEARVGIVDGRPSQVGGDRGRGSEG